MFVFVLTLRQPEQIRMKYVANKTREKWETRFTAIYNVATLFVQELDAMGTYSIYYTNNVNMAENQFVIQNVQFIAEKDGVLGGLLASIEITVDKDNVLSNLPNSNNCM